jgi:prepilin-type N-terminal cleavage/methylation domain-containing protein
VSSERGFTIVEVLIAVIILTVGLLGLASTAAYVTRMIAQGNRYTEAATLANRRLELLRGGGCSTMANGSNITGRYTVTWTVTSIVSGKGRQIQLTVTSPTTYGTRTDSFTGTVIC